MSKSKKLNDAQSNEALMFLHDLLNHTHGLKLFLESQTDSIQKAPLELIYTEVQALENQIASQFNRLVQGDIHTVAELIEYCCSQFKLYKLGFDLHKNDWQYLADEKIEVDASLIQRLVKNIIKNIYLWADKNESIQMKISWTNSQLELFFENSIAQDNRFDHDSNGVGLKSMAKLAAEQGIDLAYGPSKNSQKWTTTMLINLVGQKHLKLAC